ncbi:hypothetical protein B0T24DRAFT_670306 [Lasiosphaeria ovina]|uniref:F-box domain-containing protein n=1 Tax=Lasiosphaeria ovina TaxID=92902 RepID=A0AAE0JY46_9PEZI|nr:hypothetical protein B0T24DRAFT_670306 [Lasiosphaeria ovina]
MDFLVDPFDIATRDDVETSDGKYIVRYSQTPEMLEFLSLCQKKPLPELSEAESRQKQARVSEAFVKVFLGMIRAHSPHIWSRDIQTLRRVCRAFEAPAAAVLFRRVQLSRSKYDLRKFMLIALSPRISRHVTEIAWVSMPSCLDFYLADPEEYAEDFAGSRWSLSWEVERGSSAPVPINILLPLFVDALRAMPRVTALTVEPMDKSMIYAPDLGTDQRALVWEMMYYRPWQKADKGHEDALRSLFFPAMGQTRQIERLSVTEGSFSSSILRWHPQFDSISTNLTEIHLEFYEPDLENIVPNGNMARAKKYIAERVLRKKLRIKLACLRAATNLRNLSLTGQKREKKLDSDLFEAIVFGAMIRSTVFTGAADFDIPDQESVTLGRDTTMLGPELDTDDMDLEEDEESRILDEILERIVLSEDDLAEEDPDCQKTNEPIIWKHLESLRLLNITYRQDTLMKIVSTHSKTLRHLHLHDCRLHLATVHKMSALPGLHLDTFRVHLGFWPNEFSPMDAYRTMDRNLNCDNIGLNVYPYQMSDGQRIHGDSGGFDPFRLRGVNALVKQSGQMEESQLVAFINGKAKRETVLKIVPPVVDSNGFVGESDEGSGPDNLFVGTLVNYLYLSNWGHITPVPSGVYHDNLNVVQNGETADSETEGGLQTGLTIPPTFNPELSHAGAVARIFSSSWATMREVLNDRDGKNPWDI